MAAWGLFLLILAGLQGIEPAPLRPVWERSLNERVHNATLSSNGNCAAVTTENSIVVLGRDGHELWRWDFHQGNRFIVANNVAISPTCNWAAFVGDVGYKYVWIVHQHGIRTPLQFQNTPQAVAINHTGDKLAVGTAGNEIRLYTAQGQLLWTKSEGGVIRDISFSTDDSAVMATQWNGAVLSANGDVQWSSILGVGGMNASRDRKTFVTWSQPPHGPGTATVALRNEKGEVQWSRQAPSEPQAVISASGDLVAFRLFADQSITQFFIDQEPEHSLAILSRTGELVRKLSGDGYPVAFSADGRRLVVRRPDRFEALDLNDHVLWTIPMGLPGANLDLAITPNLDTVLLRENDRIRWFSPK